MDAWGRPTAAASVTVRASPLEGGGGSKGKQAGQTEQTLQQGSTAGEYLYSTAALHSHPATYL